MFRIQKEQPFNIFASADPRKNVVQNPGTPSAHINIQVASWNSNKNKDGSYKTLGDTGFEGSVFAVAFGETAEKIAAALKKASDEAVDGGVVKVAFRTGEGCYVKKVAHTSEKDGEQVTTFKDSYVFNNVEDIVLAAKATATAAEESSPGASSGLEATVAPAQEKVVSSDLNEATPPAKSSSPSPSM